MRRIDLACIKHALQLPIHRLCHPSTVRPDVSPVACITPCKLVLARVTFDTKAHVSDYMPCDARSLHVRLGTVAPKTTSSRLPTFEPMEMLKMVRDARLVAFDPHSTCGILAVPEAFIYVQQLVRLLKSVMHRFLVDKKTVAHHHLMVLRGSAGSSGGTCG